MAVSMVVDNDGSAGGSLCLASTVGLHASEPSWVGRDVVNRCEIDVGSVVGVQCIEIIKGQRGGDAVNHDEVILRLCMNQLSRYVTGQVGVF